ncbi:NAD(P)/FAD-dependent oxidoreductase [Candidatus Uhrbacteria bacterium]|jgi:dihydrolipoamide dehydrogenase|nr:NAD(P)/FAD-dependent oxidoreductase [Candidatus Uhrbacteria bacterium]
MTYQYDLLVIGSGSSGFSAASAAKGTGRKIGIVEEESKWGGECPNWACVPTKSLLKSAKIYRDLRHVAAHGVNVKDASIDFSAVMMRRAKIVSALAGKRVEDLAEKLGIARIKGHATFLDEHTIQVGDEQYTSERFVIATGAKTFVPPIPGLDKVDWIDFRKAVELNELPASMIIVGGGPVGCEFATAYATFGTKVTLIQGAPRVLHREEPEMSQIAHDSLVRLGVEVHVGAEVVGASEEGGKKQIRARVGKEIIKVEAELLLMATGKTSTTAGLGTKAAGVKLDERGTIIVNSELRTSAKNIWAAGDVNGGMRFTHTAHHEGSIAGYNTFAGKEGMKTDERVVPRVTFVDPEIASVGLTEEQAREKVGKILVGTFQLRGLGRAFIDGEKYGMIKIIADEKTRKILGGHVAGSRSGEMVHEIALAIYSKNKVDDLANMIHAYPTYSEGVMAAASIAIS